jgi:hypothetical protein
MKLRKYAVAFAAAAALTVITIPAASAAGYSNLCAQAGAGYCLNDWGGGGSGAAVKMYTANVVNDRFGVFTVNACNGGHFITSSCIGAWGGDPNMVGAEIVEIQYENNSSLCVATAGSGYAVMGACGDGSGTGAANGVIMALAGTPSCGGGFHYFMMDRYWSHANGSDVWLLSGGAVGNQALFSGTDQSCWGLVAGS